LSKKLKKFEESTVSKSKFTDTTATAVSVAEKLLSAKDSTQIMPRFELNSFSLRSEDNILSFSPQEAAHLIAKPPARICRGAGNGIDGEHAASS
jgi:hypothetical protein